MEINDRQRLLLEKVIEAHVAVGQLVGSKWLSEQPDVPWGPSTVRAELARLEDAGLLRHPHTSAGRVPTDRGYREHVDQILEGDNLPVAARPLGLEVSRREVDEAMRAATEQLSQVTNLLAIVTASYLILRRITQSPFGMVLQSIRENEARTRAVGYPIERYKMVAVMLSGLFAGLAGVL